MDYYTASCECGILIMWIILSKDGFGPRKCSFGETKGTKPVYAFSVPTRCGEKTQLTVPSIISNLLNEVGLGQNTVEKRDCPQNQVYLERDFERKSSSNMANRVSAVENPFSNF